MSRAAMRAARAAHPAAGDVFAEAARAVARTERHKVVAVWVVAGSVSVACWAVVAAVVVWLVQR